MPRLPYLVLLLVVAVLTVAEAQAQAQLRCDELLEQCGSRDGTTAEWCCRLAQQAVEVAEQEQQGEQLACVSWVLGRALVVLEQPQEARPRLQRAFALYQNLGDQVAAARVAVDLGQLTRAGGEPQTSLELLLLARDLLPETGGDELRRQVLLELSRTYEVLAEPDQALANLAAATRLGRQLTAAAADRHLAELRHGLQLRAKDVELALLRSRQQSGLTVRSALAVVVLLLALLAALVLRGYLANRRRDALVQARNRELQAVDRVVRAINRERELPRMLEVLLEQALAVTPAAEAATFLIREAAADCYRYATGCGLPRRDIEGLELSADEVRQRYLVDAEELLPDVFVLRSVAGRPAHEKISRRLPVPAAMLVLAIRLENQLEGLLVIDSFTAEHAFDSQDISLLVRLKEHLLSAFARALTLQRLHDLSEARSELIRIIGNDVRQPLTTLAGALQHLDLQVLRETLSAAERHEQIGAMRTQAVQIIEMLERLLDLSALESGKRLLELRPTDVRNVLARSVTSLRPQAVGKGIDLQVSCEQVPPVLADVSRLGLVINNLLTNAITFTHPDGQVRVSCAMAGSSVVIRVADNGQGLTDNDLVHLFHSFKRRSARPTAGEPSRGLGLVIARTIVELHNGRIWVDTSPGQGATFSVSLPIAEPCAGTQTSLTRCHGAAAPARIAAASPRPGL